MNVLVSDCKFIENIVQIRISHEFVVHLLCDLFELSNLLTVKLHCQGDNFLEIANIVQLYRDAFYIKIKITDELGIDVFEPSVFSGIWKTCRFECYLSGPEIAWNLPKKVRKPGQNKKWNTKPG